MESKLHFVFGLTLLAFLLHLAKSSPSNHDVKVWPCAPQVHGDNDSVQLVFIDWNEGPVGVIQTPNFPHQFPLPLRCVWVFNNTQIRQQPWHLHIYFTQFYLSNNLLTISRVNLSEGFSLDKQMEWSKLDEIGDHAKYDWFDNDHVKTDADIVILKLNIEAKAYDYLHRRVLEVNDAYGFNITFEGSFNKTEREDRCSLSGCNHNGECYVDVTREKPRRISKFRCVCASPKFNPSEHDEPFNGDRCQFLTANRECSSETKSICKNGGVCRYYTSRYVACDCPPEWTGHKCEIPTSSFEPLMTSHQMMTSQLNNSQHQNVTNSTINEGQTCFDLFTKLEVTPSIADKILAAQNGKLFPNVFKIDSPDKRVTTLYFPSSLPVTNQTLTNLSKSLEFDVGLTDLPKPEFSGFCTERLLRLTTEKRKEFVTEGDEFHLTCMAHGFKKPVFKWAKDYGYSIDKSLSGGTILNSASIIVHSEEKIHRYINTNTWPQHEDLIVEILTLNPANAFDDGLFTCKVYETLYDGVNISDFQKFPFQTSSIKVEVLQKPKIEAFPMSATIVKVDKYKKARSAEVSRYKHPRGHNTLNCFADSSVDKDVAERNYRFYWKRNGVNITDISPRTEHEEDMLEPPGKTLKLGLIESSALYTCVAVDKRDSRLTTSVDVPVYLAIENNETCIGTLKDEIMWPQTYRGAKAAIRCTKASGYMYLQCNDGSVPHHWPDHPPDRQECLNEDFTVYETRIDRYLSGYVRDPALDFRCLKDFIGNFSKIAGSKPLTIAERRLTLKLLWKIFNVIRSQNLPLNYDEMAEEYFSSILPFLFSNSGPRDLKSQIELMELLETSAKVLGSKLGDLQSSNLDLKGFEWTEPVVNGCYQTKNVTVKLVQVSQNQKNAFKKIWSYPEQIQSATAGNNIPQNVNNKDNSVAKPCPGLTRVSLFLNSSDEKFLFKANPTLAVIHFKGLESELGDPHIETVKDSNSMRIFIRNSSLVTVVYDQNTSYTDLPLLNITIRFYDSVYTNENESSRFNLSCGRVEFEPESVSNGSARAIWDRNFCNLRWSPEGMICACNKTGTFALLRSWDVKIDDRNSNNVTRHYIATLGCGVGLTMTCLTLWRLLIKLWYKIRLLTLLHTQVTLLMTGALSTILVAVAEFCPKNSNIYLASTLQFFLLSTLSCQLNIPGVLFLKETWLKRAKELRGLLLAFSILLPAMYCIFTMSMLEGDREDRNYALLHLDIPRALKEDWKSWFIDRESAHFVAYLTINTLLILLYVSLSIFVIFRLKANHKKSVGRVFLIKQSLWISLAVCLLNLSCLIFVNMGHVDGGTECLLAFPCALAGLTILCSYGMESDASVQEPPTWRYFSYKLNFNGSRPSKENCCVEIGNKREANSNGYSRETGLVPSVNESESLIPLSRRNDVRNQSGCLDPLSKDSKSNEFLNNSALVPPGVRVIARNQLGSFSRNLSTSRVPELGPSSLSRNVSLHRVSEQSEMVPMLMVQEYQSPTSHEACNKVVCEIFDASEIPVTSPVPLSELLRTIEVHSDCDDEIIAIAKADVHHGEPTPLIKFQRPPRTLTGGSCDSTCSSYDSALPRSRKNTTTTTTSGSTTVRSMSNASNRSTKVPFEDDDGMCCSSTEQQATGYVLMAGRSEYLIAANDPLGSGVNHSTDQNRRDTDSLLRQVRDKVRSRRTSSGDSADHSSEQDSSENCPEGCLIVRKISFPFVNLSETPVVRRDEESDFLYTKNLGGGGGGGGTSRRKKVKKASMPLSRSLPQIFGRKI